MFVFDNLMFIKITLIHSQISDLEEHMSSDIHLLARRPRFYLLLYTHIAENTT